MSTYHSFRFIVLLSSAIFFFGCQTANVRSDYKIDEKTESAIIIGSVTQREDAGLPTNAQFYVNYKTKHHKRLYAKKKTPLGYLGVVNEFENTGVTGRIFVIELPVGQHKIDHWSIDYGDGGGFILYPKVAPPTLNFALQTGQILYLGNFHMAIETGTGLFGQTLPVSGAPTIKDESDRDIKMFKERYPQLASEKITVNVIHSGAWVNENQIDEMLEVPKSE